MTDAINTKALANWVNGSQTVGYIDSTSSITVDSTTNYCGSCSSWYWISPHTCHHYTPAHEHDYQQATSPYESTLFCRRCGETKRLKLPKEAAK